MRDVLKQFLPCVFLILLPLTAAAAPEFAVLSSMAKAEKGHNFRLLLLIDTENSLSNLVVTGLAPEGFCLEAVSVPGVSKTETSVPRLPKVKDENEQPECAGLKNVAHVAEIPGASFILPFRAYSPDMYGDPVRGGKASLYSTRESKVFAFNILYKNAETGTAGSASTQLTLPYTTSLTHYLVAGLFGVFLGFLVKGLTQEREEINALFETESGIWTKILGLLKHLLIIRMPLLLTLLVIGFGALLALSQDGIPTSSWSQAIALGLGLGILGDEKLITKLKTPG